MIESVVMALALASVQPDQAKPLAPEDGAQPRTTVRAVPLGHLEIPDEIAPAVLPYMGCLLARDGSEVRGSYDPRPPGVVRGADCTPYREEARLRADAMLRRIGGRSADQRRDFIERTLTSIEIYQNLTSAPPPPAKSDDDAQD